MLLITSIGMINQLKDKKLKIMSNKNTTVQLFYFHILLQLNTESIMK